MTLNWDTLSLIALVLMGTQRFLYKLSAQRGCNSAWTTFTFMGTVTVLSSFVFLFSSAKVTLSIYDLLGQQVAQLVDEKQIAGVHEVSWRAHELPSGLYIAKLYAGGQQQHLKMMLVK